MTLEDPQNSFANAVRRVLRPLVAALISNGMTYTYLCRLLKELYVEVAQERFAVEGKKLTDSRISLITGVHRKDVRVLRDQHDGSFEVPQSVNLGSRIVHQWTTDPRFTDTEGHSRPLHRSQPDRSGIYFDTLAESVSKDVHSRTILDELHRLGVVRVDDDNMVHLNAEAFVPKEGFDELAYYFGSNLHDHIAAATHNLMGNKPTFLELAVDHENLSDDKVTELHEAARARGLEVLHELDRLHGPPNGNGDADPGKGHRVRFGVYFYAEKTPTAAK